MTTVESQEGEVGLHRPRRRWFSSIRTASGPGIGGVVLCQRQHRGPSATEARAVAGTGMGAAPSRSRYRASGSLAVRTGWPWSTRWAWLASETEEEPVRVRVSDRTAGLCGLARQMIPDAHDPRGDSESFVASRRSTPSSRLWGRLGTTAAVAEFLGSAATFPPVRGRRRTLTVQFPVPDAANLNRQH